ncbi:MAG: DNA-protecting protein DprA [Candidatus Omnitrophica bacterium]|nr:DNA-protecting protein DprA [Candidatus Omnitrophota bacterium]
MTSVPARDMIALNLIPGLSPRVIKRLLESVAKPDEIFRMTESEIRKIVLKPAGLAAKIRGAKLTSEYKEELAYMRENNIEAICVKDESYPENLKNIYDPPAVLYSRGALTGVGENAVAMVGARRCSAYGLQMAERIAFDLAKEGITVASGMARGIDTAAHKGVVKAGGKTIAVMGSGFKHIYPPEAKSLIPAIAEKGAVITEYASGTIPFKGNFPRRNRIISGMVRAVIVVEAAVRSGAMITANFALSEGRDVFAVPGRADFYSSKGSNMLIQKGAALVMSADDVLKELNVENGKTKNDVVSNVSPRLGSRKEYGGMIELLKTESPVHIDRISEETGIELKNLSAVLLSLQIRGTIKELPGKNYILANQKGK